MAFFSFAFLLFVLCVTLIYFVTPGKYQWIVLLAASYFFYWLNSGYLLLVMFASTLVTFLIGRWIEAENGKGQQYLQEHKDLTGKEKKAYKSEIKKRTGRILRLGIFFDLGVLLFLKYFNFFGENINKLFQLASGASPVPTLHLLLPLGISFYTLQAIAYMTDIYRGKITADRNLGKFMLFMSFFPQIVQGPIPRHKQLAEQLYASHTFDYKRFTFGIQLILWGFIKKLVIADRLAIPVNELFDHYENHSGLILFFGAAMYGLQVYTDFSGGMDIARGVSEILGIELELNFRQPYFSTSIEDFWRRWHITLGSFMRDYIFYPLSLSKGFAELGRRSRKVLGQFAGKRLPAFLAMFIVYILVGFWHGSSWNYIAYGLYNGVFIMAGIPLEEVYDKAREKGGIGKEDISWRVFQMFRTFMLVSIGRYFSRGSGFMAAWNMMKLTTVQWRDLSFLTDGTFVKLGLNTASWFILLASILLLFLVDYFHEKEIHIRETIAAQSLIFRWIIYIAAICFVLIFGIYGPEYSASSFIYEQF